jgi:hypothetical protein
MLFSAKVSDVVGLIQLHMHWAPEVLSQAVKRPDHDPGLWWYVRYSPCFFNSFSAETLIVRKLNQTGIHGENFPLSATTPKGPGSPHHRCLKITLKNITLGRTPLDKWSAWRRDIYLTTHNTHERETALSPAPAIPTNQWLQTHDLDRAATGIGLQKIRVITGVCNFIMSSV